MSNIEKFLQNFKEKEAQKINADENLDQTLIEGLEAMSLDMRLQSSLLQQCMARINEVDQSVITMEQRLGSLKLAIDATEARIKSAIDENEDLNTLKHDFENLSINVRNNNKRIETFKSDAELIKATLSSIKCELKGKPLSVPKAVPAEVKNLPAAISSTPEAKSDYEDIDYFDFENHFRGSIESIKEAQKFYLKYFKGKKHVLDIGCGRGEFLSLLAENGINSEGADIYKPYVDYCRMKGFKAVCMDGIEYLNSLEKTDGIFVGQVVEHLETSQIIRLCNTAYEKLTEGGCIVIETPNPTSLIIYTNAFYIDPSHVKPVHPLTMRYYLEKAGFRNIEVIYTESSRPDQKIPELIGSFAANAEEFNAAMKTVSDIIFGSQDYAVIAVK